ASVSAVMVDRHHSPTEVVPPLSLHDALPICQLGHGRFAVCVEQLGAVDDDAAPLLIGAWEEAGHVLERDERDVESVAKSDEASRDRKSTRLNSSHVKISYAVFCLKQKLVQ